MKLSFNFILEHKSLYIKKKDKEFMETLEQKVPNAVNLKTVGTNYGEKQLLSSYMNGDPASVYECSTGNNCGSGDCSSCCGSTDD